MPLLTWALLRGGAHHNGCLGGQCVRVAISNDAGHSNWGTLGSGCMVCGQMARIGTTGPFVVLWTAKAMRARGVRQHPNSTRSSAPARSTENTRTHCRAPCGAVAAHRNVYRVVGSQAHAADGRTVCSSHVAVGTRSHAPTPSLSRLQGPDPERKGPEVVLVAATRKLTRPEPRAYRR